MAIAYPRDFACPSRIEGHSAVVSTGLVRTPMEGGNTRQRRMQRQAPQLISLVFVMPQTELADWLSWVNAYAFDQWIDIDLPGVLASRAGTQTAATPVRFCSDIALTLVPVHRLWYWQARVSCEWLPTAEDLRPWAWIIADLDDETIETSSHWVIAGTPDAPSPDLVTAGGPAAPSAPL